MACVRMFGMNFFDGANNRLIGVVDEIAESAGPILAHYNNKGTLQYMRDNDEIMAFLDMCLDIDEQEDEFEREFTEVEKFNLVMMVANCYEPRMNDPEAFAEEFNQGRYGFDIHYRDQDRSFISNEILNGVDRVQTINMEKKQA